MTNLEIFNPISTELELVEQELITSIDTEIPVLDQLLPT